MTDFIINFAFEKWNEEYQWWHPNNFPLDFVVDGIKQTPFTHDFMWFEHPTKGFEIDYHNKDSYWKLPAAKGEILDHYRNIRFKLLSEITGKYIYPIMIRTWDYFQKNMMHGFNFISDKVLSDVKAGTAKIVLIHPWEGPCGNPDWEILDGWCKLADLNKDQVFFLHGNFNKPNRDYNFTYIPVSAFYSILPPVEDIIDFSPAWQRNLFLCYNRGIRYHRTVVLCELIRAGIFDRGIISYSQRIPNTKNLITQYGRADLYEAAAYLDSVLPLELEYNLQKETPSNVLTLNHHSKTFLSLVTETLTEKEVMHLFLYQTNVHSPIFFSEKIWKSVAVGQPFLVVSSKGYLKELQNQGYKTFNKWWDESYDNEPDLENRIKMIANILVDLSKLNIQQLKTIRNEMLPILVHNQQLYKHNKHLSRNSMHESSFVEIQKIWNSF
jgi:hypothetical protein